MNDGVSVKVPVSHAGVSFQEYCWRVFPHLLEGKAQHGNLFAGDCVEHGVNHALHKALFLVVIDVDHLFAPPLRYEH